MYVPKTSSFSQASKRGVPQGFQNASAKLCYCGTRRIPHLTKLYGLLHVARL